MLIKYFFIFFGWFLINSIAGLAQGNWLYNFKADKCEPFPDFNPTEAYRGRQQEGYNCKIDQHDKARFYVMTCTPKATEGAEEKKEKGPEGTKLAAKALPKKESPPKAKGPTSILYAKSIMTCKAGADVWKKSLKD